MILRNHKKSRNLHFIWNFVPRYYLSRKKRNNYNKMKIKTLLFSLMAIVALSLNAQNNIAEEVAWVVGDEPIFKSDIEEQYQQALYECIIFNCCFSQSTYYAKRFLHISFSR